MSIDDFDATNSKYRINIYGNWLDGDVLEVSLSKRGFEFIKLSSLQCTVFKILNVTLLSLLSDGEANYVNTTFLTLNTSSPINGLAIGEITLTNKTTSSRTITVSSVNNDPLQYRIGISGTWNEGDVVEISVQKLGYNISLNPTATLHWATPIVITSVDVDGEEGEEPSTTLTLVTDHAVEGLSASDLTLTKIDAADDSNVILGDIQAEYETYTFPLSGNWTEGDVYQITVRKFGYQITGMPQITLHNKNVTITSVTQVGGAIGTLTTQSLSIQLTSTIDGLAKECISVSDITTPAAAINVNSITITDTLVNVNISGSWNNSDNCTVVITRRGYVITSPEQPTTIYRDITTHYNVVSVTPDGSAGTTTTTKLTLQLNTGGTVFPIVMSEVVVTNQATDETITVTGVSSQASLGSGLFEYEIFIQCSWTDGTEANVALVKEGYTFENNNRTVTLSTSISAYKKLEANGASGETLTTKLTLDILHNETWALLPADIQLVLTSTAPEASITVNSVSDPTISQHDSEYWDQYEIGITGKWYNGDLVTLAIVKVGCQITGDISTYLFTPFVTINGVVANGEHLTTSLTVTLDKDVGTLTNQNIFLTCNGHPEIIITIGDVTGPTGDGTSGYVYQVNITGNWTKGTVVNIVIDVAGYTFNPYTDEIVLN